MIYNFPEFIKSFGPINKKIIFLFESTQNIVLPEVYKKFLLLYNGGKSEKNIFSITNQHDESIINNFFGIIDQRYYNISLYAAIYKKRVPINTLPIASDVFGNLILLSVKGEDYGKIYYWDHEGETEPADYSNLTLIADSFDEFISMLKS